MKMDQKQAEQIARLFNVVFNSAFLYGGSHPTTHKNITLFHEILESELTNLPLISLIVDRESLYVEEWCMDKIINVKRIVSQLTKCEIVSLSFSRGVMAEEIREIIRLTGDSKECRPAKDIERELAAAGILNIKINYIKIGKITADQALVDKDLAVGGGTYDAESVQVTTSLSRNALQQIEQVLTMANLIDQPGKTAVMLSEAACNPETSDEALRSIENLRSEINKAGPLSLDVLLEAVYELKADLAETIEVQKTTGKILSTADPVRKQVNELTCDIILKLVKEEYQHGTLPIKRLVQIVRRMLPDISELKELLPRLKVTLLEEGMSLADYLQFIRDLDLELESEAIAGSLKDAAESIGVTVKDIVSAIKSEPQDSAKLIYLASEIRRGTGSDETQLSNLLADYIEKISVEVAMDSGELAKPQGSRILRRILMQLENSLIDKLKNAGIEEPVLISVKQQLSSRFESVFDEAALKYINDSKTEKDSSPEEVSRKILNFIEHQDQISRLQRSLVENLKEKGFDADRINQLLNRLSKTSLEIKRTLPPGTLYSNNMLFLLDREMKQHQRYKTPFSTMMISAVKIISQNAPRSPSRDEIVRIIPPLFLAVKELLRDIDLIGFIQEPETGVIFVLLAMTDSTGAGVARERLRQKINTLQLTINDQICSIEPAISITTPTDEKPIDLKTFLETAKKNHVEEIRARVRGKDITT